MFKVFSYIVLSAEESNTTSGPPVVAHNLQNVSNRMMRTIWFSNRMFRFFHVNGKHPWWPTHQTLNSTCNYTNIFFNKKSFSLPF